MGLCGVSNESAFNPITAQACKENIFRSYNTSTFRATYFDENPFTCQREKEDKRVKDVKFRTLIGRFQ